MGFVSEKNETSTPGCVRCASSQRMTSVSTAGTIAIICTGSRRVRKLEPSRSRTSKKTYENVIVTHAMEIARPSNEPLNDRTEASMSPCPVVGYRSLRLIPVFVRAQPFKNTPGTIEANTLWSLITFSVNSKLLPKTTSKFLF